MRRRLHHHFGLVLALGLMGAALAACTALAPTASTPPAALTPVPTPLGGGSGQIVFLQEEEGPVYHDMPKHLYRIGADGAGLTPLFDTEDADRAPVWSPDTTDMIYTDVNRHCQAEFNYTYYVRHVNGNRTMLAESAGGWWEQPAWSPDGQHILYAAGCGKRQVYLANADGATQRAVTQEGSNTAPVWSPDGGRIAFVSDRDGSRQIYLMEANGTHKTRLTYLPGAYFAPAWSPDGKRIAFASDRGGRSNLYVINTNGAHPKSLASGVDGYQQPQWSPDGTRLLFVSNLTGNDEVYVISPDGSNLFNLTNDPGDDEYPRWSPDGGFIVFVSNREDQTDLYLVRPDGSNLTRITNDANREHLPVWEPGPEPVRVFAAPPVLPTPTSTPVPTLIPWGQTAGRIAFVSDRTGNNDIFLMDEDGKNVAQLTNHPAGDIDPAWSPDGQRIAFVSNRDGNNEIYVVSADGTGLTRVTSREADDRHPAWSPDGARIVFSSNAAGNPDLYRINADGSNVVHLTDTPDMDTWPAWSPDGSRIAFSRYVESEGISVYMMNADGTNVRPFPAYIETDEPAPAWSPDGTRIAYTYHGTNIFVADADGWYQDRPYGLEQQPFQQHHPGWSRDGLSLVFDASGDDGQDIFTYNLGTGLLTCLTQGPADDVDPAWWQPASSGSLAADPLPVTRLTNNRVSDTFATWSPNGDRFAYVSYDPETQRTELHLMNADGSGATQVTSDLAIATRPGWSPDGEWITFTAYQEDEHNLYIVHPDGSDLTLMASSVNAPGLWSPDGAYLAYPLGQEGSARYCIRYASVEEPARCVHEIKGLLLAWSPDSVHVVVVREEKDSFGSSLWLTDIWENETVQLSADGACRQCLPVWSPDGTRVAYTEDQNHGSDVWIVDTNSQERTLLTPYSRYDWGPIWSPDGRAILITSSRTGSRDFFWTAIDTQTAVPLTNHPASDAYPALSPDGKRLVFSSWRNEGVAELYLMDLTALPGPSTPTPTPTAATMPSIADRPGCGHGRIVYFSQGEDNKSSVSCVNPDGSGATQLDFKPRHYLDTAWSPDGRRLAFGIFKMYGTEVALVNAEGDGFTYLTEFDKWSDGSSWSPDGTRIAFSSDYSSSTRDLYIMNADGSNIVPVYTASTDDFGPVWSPNGTRLAFSRKKGSSWDVCLVTIQGGTLTCLTDHPAVDESPVWSPDGRRLAFMSVRDGNQEIYVMNADGSQQTRLTDNSANDMPSGWSPDGRRILFSSDRDGNWEIYIMDADGSNVVRLTHRPGNDSGAVWLP